MKCPPVLCLIYRFLLSKVQGFYKFIIAESCCSISLIFGFPEKGPIFNFRTGYPGAASKPGQIWPKGHHKGQFWVWNDSRLFRELDQGPPCLELPTYPFQLLFRSEFCREKPEFHLYSWKLIKSYPSFRNGGSNSFNSFPFLFFSVWDHQCIM